MASTTEAASSGGAGTPPVRALAVCEGLAVEQHAAMALIELRRPQAANALSDEMRRTVAGSLSAVLKNPDIYALVIRSQADVNAVPERASVFSAGGDLRELTALARADLAAARRSQAAEYALNWALDCFAKPTVSLIDGLVVGSGVGLTQYGTHRVAGPGYEFAMPETSIGLFPDVGVASVFAGLPAHIGLYLGLTGHRLGRADAYHLGLVTHCLERDQFASVAAAIAEAEPIDRLLDGLHRDPGTGVLAVHESMIADAFAADTVAEIVARLGRMAGGGGSAVAWAQTTLRALGAAAPLSLVLAFEQIRATRAGDLRGALELDFRLMWRCLEAPDLFEGVRAFLVEKDHTPAWSPRSLADVDPARVAAAFAPLPAGQELALATREAMQDPSRWV